MNVPALVGTVLSIGAATLHELATVYGTEDCHDLIEVARVDAHNRRLLMPEK